MFSSIVKLQVLHACSLDVLHCHFERVGCLQVLLDVFKRSSTVGGVSLQVLLDVFKHSSIVGGVSLQVLLDVFKYFETA